MKTYHQKPTEVQRDWYVIDASGKVLGRLATQISTLLRGKHKPTFTPSIDGGDFVIVVNAEKIVLTGRKPDQKIYYRHTGYPGGIKATPYKMMLAKHPDRILRLAVKRMLPKNRMGRRLLSKLRIYAGPNHPHAAQQPKPYIPRW
ncbi:MULTISPECIES: 50S ribosomal protein L13 [Chloroflexus]|uniref:Large ribosomal subunit protein uL13 n=2 Tax=Chloroflexus aurantiacus TaxID=1108 RepID=RL13_CHLAA|nr:MULTISPECIES: 50S ribosomal protein L13 [Chloroflexus]A9WH96.1 RecName: Full=Large ribosomal subunit protein uL13; AltName: Full=50S ribosomal protein L13 [Chloroflexus aurantiacus J-10-fl]B9LJG2.1 RecName: Full=Large ribosomal subunit protein uL13; AltName: Full=50S ribosomal protein L13 [Chloroflexus aurantiacus Y-400-fl]RMG48014.1 MAG: 50S ribosomal protein L13 [Chloroflexota bacterium]HBW67948.1 50S ribosomal protein L13 [Chloroflexus aurantiacus]ABY35608.1 ribosomal protein L13 [Chloro